MDNKYILKKLISALNSFSDHELQQLATLFKEPAVNEAIVKVIEGTLALRNVKRKSKIITTIKSSARTEVKRETPEKNNVTASEIKIGTHYKNQIEQKFAALLANKNLFPSTKDVVNVVNTSFHWRINYIDFYKRGRRDLIQKCIRKLSTYSEREQRKMIKSFLECVKEQPGEKDQQYRILFKILAGDE